MDTGTAAPSTTNGSATNGASNGSASTPSTGGEKRQVIPSNPGAGPEPKQAKDTPERSEDGTEKPKPTKYKVKRGGQEAEYDVDELQRLASDDHEYEINASGKLVKLKYPDLLRSAQMGLGAYDKMREAHELKTSVEGQRKSGRENPSSYLEEHLGIPDAFEWARDQVLARIKEEEELDALLKTNASEYHRRLEKKAADKVATKTAREQKVREAEARAHEVEKQRQETRTSIINEMKAVGLPINDTTTGIAGRVWQKYNQVGHQLPHADLASMVRQEYLSEITGFLDAFDDDALLNFLGDGRRKKLRELELRVLNGGGKKPSNDNAEPRSAPKPRRERTDGMSEAEFLRQFRSK